MLSVKNLTKIYKTKGGNDTRALDNVSLDFPESGMIFLLGKSGSGKSTLLNLIGGLDFPTSGEIILKGRSSKDFSQSDFDSYRNTYVGFVFQEYNILNEFNVEQNIALAIELQGKKVKQEDVTNLLEQVDLKDFAKRKPNTLSGGQKQRIAIARALIKQPNIIMADEPTGALDSKTGEQVFETLKKLSSDKLVIVVSHDRDFAERFGDRIIELKDGKVISDETKHYIDSKNISDNVAIINDHAIKINDAKKLTKADFDKLYESIKKSDGKVFISSGINADKSMKIARISEDGKSDEFKKTEAIKLNEYDAKKTTFIKSKMPMGKSIKMGLSSLKTKPVRLVFTMLLSVVSFSMFGIASSLMLYNPAHTYSDALKRSDYKSELVTKSSKGYYVNQQINGAGEVIKERRSSTSRYEKFGVEEINSFNNNSLGLVYIPVGQTNMNFTGLSYKKNAEYYSTYYKIRYVSDTNKETFDKLSYQLEGSFPSADNEILLPKTMGQMLIDSQASSKSSYTALIGDSFKFSCDKGNVTLKVVGFYDAGDVPQTYDELKKSDSSLTGEEKEELGKDLNSYMLGSFNCVSFVSSKLYDQVVREDSNDDWVNPYYRKGARITASEGEKPSDVSEDPFDVYTDVIYNKQPSSFSLYDLDGNKLSSLSLKDDEAFVPKNVYENNAYPYRSNMLRAFLGYIVNDNQFESNYERYTPTYYAWASTHIDEVRELNYSIYGDPTSALEVYETYKNEFDKAFKLGSWQYMFAQEYKNSTNYSSLSSSDKELFDTVLNGVNYPTSEQINAVYNILYDNFDKADACPNYLPHHYLNRAYNGDKYREMIENDDTLNNLISKNYKSWTSSEIDYVKTFLNTNCQNGFSTHNNEFYDLLGAYTFKEFKSVNEKVLEPNKNMKYYWFSYNGTSGELKVVGYYSLSSNYSEIPLVTKSFIDSISLPQDNRGGGETWIYHYETKYQAPADAKYGRAMVKTDYSQAQIEFMKKSNDANVVYDLSSAKYMKAYSVVSMINLLKNIFLWVGVGFGVFAALMLLNFISVSISSKKRDIGILRAIGARKSDVFKIFFSESLFIGALCAVLALIITFVTQYFLDNYFVKQIGISLLQFQILTIVLVIGVALVIAFVATIFPVLHSSRKPPVESIRAL